MDRRRPLLVAALGFVHFAPVTLASVALHTRLDSWRGIGQIVVGTQRQGYVVSIKKWRDGGWTASLSRDVMLSSDGFGSGETPWKTVQQAAWQVMCEKAR